MSTLQHKPLKVLIQMSGPPGSGKSTTARSLRLSINAVIIDHDVLRSSLLETNNIQFHQAAKQAYSLQWALTEDFMNQGLNVIIDSPCNYQETITRGSALALQHGYVYWYIECQVQDSNLLDRRLRTRHPMISQRTGLDCPPAAAQRECSGEDTLALENKWAKIPCRPDDNIIFIDSTEEPEKIRDQILERIKS